MSSDDDLTTESGSEGNIHESTSAEMALLNAITSTATAAIERSNDTNDIPRRGFRHELASALAWLEHHRLATAKVADADETHQRAINLVAYLIAAHHGKVRLSIRSMPNEKRPGNSEIRFARGIWEGDSLPQVNLGNGKSSSAVDAISLEWMTLGESETHGESWLARTLALRDHYGPFRLAFLEMLLRVADWRGSRLGNGDDPVAGRSESVA